jgi:hypothetical protein
MSDLPTGIEELQVKVFLGTDSRYRALTPPYLYLILVLRYCTEELLEKGRLWLSQ